MKAVAPDPSELVGQRSRILVVDDEQSMRELLGIVLRREGYGDLKASDGRQAVEMPKREASDLRISHIKMPDMSGVEVRKAAKLLDADIIGIMVTAYASVENA